LTFPCFKRGARVRLESKTLQIDSLDEELYRAFIGGKGLGGFLLFNYLAPGTNPLSPENVLLLLTGPLSGSGFPGSSRATLVTKSPLTGTLFITGATQLTGVLPTRTWQERGFEGADKISSDAFFERKVKSKSCLSCPVGCSAMVRKGIVESNLAMRRPEYETIYAFGSNCGIDDPDTILDTNMIQGV
jgi:aldehyde:ferredoxin oxidoreductase